MRHERQAVQCWSPDWHAYHLHACQKCRVQALPRACPVRDFILQDPWDSAAHTGSEEHFAARNVTWFLPVGLQEDKMKREPIDQKGFKDTTKCRV